MDDRDLKAALGAEVMKLTDEITAWLADRSTIRTSEVDRSLSVLRRVVAEELARQN